MMVHGVFSIQPENGGQRKFAVCMPPAKESLAMIYILLAHLSPIVGHE